MTNEPPGSLLYENPLATPEDVAGFRLEGQAIITFDEGRMRLRNALDPALGQRSNFVYWCPVAFPDHVAITWDFWPVEEPGLCILFLAARGHQGRDLFDPALAPRTGEYRMYHHGEMDALHVSYFRRRIPETRAFNVCNLRKSYGFHMAATGADPLPSVADAQPPYRMRVIKTGASVEFAINDLPVLRFVDDGRTYGPLLAGGYVGFRQMAPMVGAYANLCVSRLESRE